MPTGRVIGEYWKDYNQRNKDGQVSPWVSIPLNFTPGPAIGEFYSGIQSGNPFGWGTAALSAVPAMPAINLLKGARLGNALPTEVQSLVGASGNVPAKLNAAGTRMNYWMNEGKNWLSDFASQNPIDISFGSKEGGSRE